MPKTPKPAWMHGVDADTASSIIRRGGFVKASVAALAREDPGVFNAFVLRDEKTGRAIQQAPVHDYWLRLVQRHPWLIIWAFIESGKTQQLAVGYTLWRLGRDPNLRVFVISETKAQAAKITRSMKRYIRESARVRQVFPHLKLATPAHDDAFAIQRDGYAKDFSVEAVGMDGHIMGARGDLFIIDDLVTLATTRTPYQRAKTLEWLETTPFSRLTDGAQIVFLCNAWEIDDPPHELAKRVGWHAVRSPVIDPDTGDLAWPQRWPQDRIDEWRRNHGEPEYERQLGCRPRPRGAGRFRKEWVDLCLGLGEGRSMVHSLAQLPEDELGLGGSVEIGVDLAMGKQPKGAETAFFVMHARPDGVRRPLAIEAGNGDGWAGPDIINRIVDLYRRFRPLDTVKHCRFTVESVAAQVFIVQFARVAFERLRKEFPELREVNVDRLVQPFHTGGQKAHPEYGVEGIATEMSTGRWVLPSVRNASGELTAAHPQLLRWLNECLQYDPAGHTGDRLMASWFAREGARQGTFVYEATTLAPDPAEAQDRYAHVVSRHTEKITIGKGTERWQRERAMRKQAWDQLGEELDLDGVDYLEQDWLRRGEALLDEDPGDAWSL